MSALQKLLLEQTFQQHEVTHVNDRALQWSALIFLALLAKPLVSLAWIPRIQATQQQTALGSGSLAPSVGATRLTHPESVLHVDYIALQLESTAFFPLQSRAILEQHALHSHEHVLPLGVLLDS